jgi:hypothetical protein
MKSPTFENLTLPFFIKSETQSSTQNGTAIKFHPTSTADEQKTKTLEIKNCQARALEKDLFVCSLGVKRRKQRERKSDFTRREFRVSSVEVTQLSRH